MFFLFLYFLGREERSADVILLFSRVGRYDFPVLILSLS